MALFSEDHALSNNKVCYIKLTLGVVLNGSIHRWLKCSCNQHILIDATSSNLDFLNNVIAKACISLAACSFSTKVLMLVVQSMNAE